MEHKRVCKAFQSILDLTLFPPLPVPCTHDEWWSSRQAGVKAVEVLLSMMGAISLNTVRRR